MRHLLKTGGRDGRKKAILYTHIGPLLRTWSHSLVDCHSHPYKLYISSQVLKIAQNNLPYCTGQRSSRRPTKRCERVVGPILGEERVGHDIVGWRAPYFPKVGNGYQDPGLSTHLVNKSTKNPNHAGDEEKKKLTVMTNPTKITTWTLYGYVITVDVMFDQSSVMFSRPMPLDPAPRKLTLWLSGANQQRGASAATMGKRNSGRNCHANVARRRM